MKYEVAIEIELVRYFKVEANNKDEAMRKAKNEAFDSLEPVFTVQYSDELCRLEVLEAKKSEE